MFQIKIGEGLSGDVLLKMLRNNCDGIESEHSYLRIFTEYELDQMKDKLSESSIKLKEIEEQKKEANAKFKSEMDLFKIEINELLENLKEKQRIVCEEVYLVRNDQLQMMGYYNSNGDLVDQQPMTDEQRQSRIDFD